MPKHYARKGTKGGLRLRRKFGTRRPRRVGKGVRGLGKGKFLSFKERL